MTGPITDFNPGARNDARRDERYPAVLEQVRKMAWPAGNPMVPGGWADTLAKDVMAAIRKAEGQHRLITHHAYVGPGECQGRYYGLGPCGYPEAEHAPVDGPPQLIRYDCPMCDWYTEPAPRESAYRQIGGHITGVHGRQPAGIVSKLVARLPMTIVAPDTAP